LFLQVTLRRVPRQRNDIAHANTATLVLSFATYRYTRAAELAIDAEDIPDQETRRRESAGLHSKAAEAWTNMNEKAKAAGSKVQAAVALNYGDESRLLSKEALAGMEEAVEAHVPDVLNPYARYRQTGHSAFIDPDSDESVTSPSPENLALAAEHIVTRSYAHEPLLKLVVMLVDYGEYASALYAAGAASTILKKDGISTLTLGRSFVTETILTLAMGDPVAAEEQFLKRHVQETSYLTSRECKLSEELFRAIKTRDGEALEEARNPTGSNRGGLANLHKSLQTLVGMLRLSGTARKTVGDTVAPAAAKKPRPPKEDGSGTKDGTGTRKTRMVPKKKSPAAEEKPEVSLEELIDQKTGYEQDEAAGANLNPDALQSELDDLNFDDLDSDDGLEDDDDVDLR
jgi:hypothetical protein